MSVAVMATMMHPARRHGLVSSTTRGNSTVDGMGEDRLNTARAELDGAIEDIRELCEPVSPPKRLIDYQNYFCARNLANHDVVARNAPRRAALYEAVARYENAYAALEGTLPAAGYSEREVTSIIKEVEDFRELRYELRRAAGEAQ